MSNGAGRGIEFLQQVNAQRGFGGNKDRMRQFWLRDDQDTARIAFVTDGGDCVVRGYHQRTIKGRPGKKDWTKEVLCPRPFNEDGSISDDVPCVDCEGGDDPWVKPAFLLYVLFIDHQQPGEGWQQGKRGNLVVYRETINEPRIWLVKNKEQARVFAKYGEHGTLSDVLYDYKRLGARGDNQTSYELTRLADKPTSAIASQLQGLPDLTEQLEKDFIDNFKPRQERVSAPVASFDEDADADDGRDDADIIEF